MAIKTIPLVLIEVQYFDFHFNNEETLKVWIGRLASIVFIFLINYYNNFFINSYEVLLEKFSGCGSTKRRHELASNVRRFEPCYVSKNHPKSLENLKRIKAETQYNFSWDDMDNLQKQSFQHISNNNHHLSDIIFKSH